MSGIDKSRNGGKSKPHFFVEVKVGARHLGLRVGRSARLTRLQGACVGLLNIKNFKLMFGSLLTCDINRGGKWTFSPGRGGLEGFTALRAVC